MGVGEKLARGVLGHQAVEVLRRAGVLPAPFKRQGPAHEGVVPELGRRGVVETVLHVGFGRSPVAGACGSDAGGGPKG